MRIFRRKTSLLDRIGKAASPKTIVPLSVGAWLLRRKNPRAIRIPIATLLAVATSDLLKSVVDERRPSLFCKEEWSSFPSGHSAATGALLLGLAHLTSSPATPSRPRRWGSPR